MKKIMILLLLLLMWSTALADTLTLTVGLEIIGEEAFYGDTSLDEEIIGYDALTIDGIENQTIITDE